jgi:hypothetical protein
MLPICHLGLAGLLGNVKRSDRASSTRQRATDFQDQLVEAHRSNVMRSGAMTRRPKLSKLAKPPGAYVMMRREQPSRRTPDA